MSFFLNMNLILERVSCTSARWSFVYHLTRFGVNIWKSYYETTRLYFDIKNRSFLRLLPTGNIPLRMLGGLFCCVRFINLKALPVIMGTLNLNLLYRQSFGIVILVVRTFWEDLSIWFDIWHNHGFLCDQAFIIEVSLLIFDSMETVRHIYSPNMYNETSLLVSDLYLWFVF